MARGGGDLVEARTRSGEAIANKRRLLLLLPFSLHFKSRIFYCDRVGVCVNARVRLEDEENGLNRFSNEAMKDAARRDDRFAFFISTSLILFHPFQRGSNFPI